MPESINATVTPEPKLLVIERPSVPSNELVEAEVRAYLALFCADTQPAELQALRRLALRWMLRLAEFRPHLGGAAWRGTATRQSSLHLDLYCDDPKSMEIESAAGRLDFDPGLAPELYAALIGPIESVVILIRSPSRSA